jgi:methyl-accepting chemotaxis protein
MEELTSVVQQNADSSQQAISRAQSAIEATSKVGAIVSQAVHTMGWMNESVKRIVGIMGLVNGIAFQASISA